MTTLHQQYVSRTAPEFAEPTGLERRAHRRHDLEQRNISVGRWNEDRQPGQVFGQLVDLSAGGVRIRTSQKNLRPDHQVRVRLELPVYAGISPFVDHESKSLRPKREWTGWMTVARVQPAGPDCVDVAGRLVDMDEMDRGMLSLYLSTQPLAA